MCDMVHGKRGEISEAAMNTNPAFNLCKKRRKKYPLEKYLCIEIQTNLRTGMHILYHIKIDIMS